MKNKDQFKRVLSLLLAFMLFALPMTACKGNKGDNTEGLSEFVYVPQYTTIPDEVMDITNPYLNGDTIYFTANTPIHSDGTPATKEEIEQMNKDFESYRDVAYATAAPAADTAVVENAEPPQYDITYKTFIYSIKKDGTGYSKLSDFVPKEASEENYSYANLNKLIVDPNGNIWTLETVNQTIFNLPAGFDANKEDPWEYYDRDERQNYIRKLSNTGAELSSIDLNQFVDKESDPDMEKYGFYINDMIADKSGNLYVTDSQNTVYVIGADGNFLFKLSVENWLDRLVPLKDGTVGVTTGSDDGKNIIKTIDVKTKAWGKEHNVPMNVWRISYGGDKYDFCYTDSSSLYGYNVETESNEKILSWLNSDVDGDSVQFSTIMDNENVFAISQNWDREGESNFEIITLVKTPRSEIKQKKILTLATVWVDYNLRKELLKFNKTNQEYRIEVIDYSEFSTEEDWEAGITKLNTEIISGHVPDLIDVSQLPYQQYAAKGLLEDLYTYIDKDPDIKREDFIPSIIKAIEMDGKLYQLATNFSIASIIGKSSVVGEEMGWTVDEMQAIIDEHPEAIYPFGQQMTRSNILEGLCMLNMNNFMNWQTGECSFNSDDFKKLLTFAKTFPEKIPEIEEGEWVHPATLIQEGKQIFDIFSGSDFREIQYSKFMFGDDITFKGFPTESRKGNVAQLNGGLVMTTSCKDKDGAWQFMRTLLKSEYQENLDWNFPVTQKAFDKRLEEEMKQEYYTDENGNKVPVSRGGMSIGNGPTMEFYAITPEEADQIKALVNSIESMISYNRDVFTIIDDEAKFYFSGEKSVDETVDIIQSRMNIYINEQR